MRKQLNQLLQLSVLIVFVAANNVAAYEDKITHPALTKKATENTQLDLYLKNQLGLSDGVSTIFTLYNPTMNILALLQQGSKDEDKERCRRANHMHNPMNWISWNDSYMSDEPSWWWPIDCSSWSRKYSNVTWATGYLAPAPNGAKASFTIDPQYAPNNWDMARQYYYSALTSQTSTARETAFAQTFQAVGQVMHLLQDMAVPAHTRNDFASHLTQNGSTFRVKSFSLHFAIFCAMFAPCPVPSA